MNHLLQGELAANCNYHTEKKLFVSKKILISFYLFFCIPTLPPPPSLKKIEVPPLSQRTTPTHPQPPAKFFKSYMLSACSCHVMYVFQSKSTLCSCLNVKELLADIMGLDFKMKEMTPFLDIEPK